MSSESVDRAIAVALAAHDGQTRRNSDRPYVVHPIHVALLLAGAGANEDIVQAGLLHDVVEDCDDWNVERVELEFSPTVASIVAEVTEDKSLGWTERKEHGVDAVSGMSDGALLVKACDKLHNLESIAHALRRADDPASVWSAFKGGRERSIELSDRLVRALTPRLASSCPETARALELALDAVRTQ